VIATATLAAIVASGGLGQFITEGIEVRDNVELVCGSLLVVALAVTVEILLAGLQRLLLPTRRHEPIRSLTDDQPEESIHATVS
jgi:osmoprotectant transport system permease protein